MESNELMECKTTSWETLLGEPVKYNGDLFAEEIKTDTADDNQESPEERIKNFLNFIDEVPEAEYGVPVEDVVDRAVSEGYPETVAKHVIDQLKQKGELYEPATDYVLKT